MSPFADEDYRRAFLWAVHPLPIYWRAIFRYATLPVGEKTMMVLVRNGKEKPKQRDWRFPAVCTV